MNEFRINHSPSSMNHPDYVFGKVGNKYKSFGLTHTPKPEFRSKELLKNPNSKDLDVSYIQTKVKTTSQKYFSKPMNNWSFHPDDRAYVRHIIKKYRKKRK